MNRFEQIRGEAFNRGYFYKERDLFEEGANFADEHRWISKDDLPENHQQEGCNYSEKVFLRIQRGTYIEYCAGGYDFKNKRWVIQVYGKVEEMPYVTHWMPIPPTSSE